jgi:aminoglycoside 6'-N-acetyltransferase
MRTELQPLDVAHVARLRELREQPEVTRWWGPMERGFPFDEPEALRFAIVADGQVAGMLQVGEEKWPEGRHAWIDIFVGDDFSGRGIGSAAVRQAADMLIAERGHHRVTIDPHAANAAAIRCYEKAGFQRVGVIHSAFRTPGGEWVDELLMELVAL